MINLLIADPSQVTRELLKSICQDLPFVETIHEAQDGAGLVQTVKHGGPNVVITSVELPGLDGIEAAEIVEKIDPAIIFIFLSDDDKNLRRACNIYAYDYLLKPVGFQRVFRTLRRICALEKTRLEPADQKPAKNHSLLLVEGKEESKVLHLQDIIMITRNNRRLEIICKNHLSYQLWRSLDEMQERLPFQFFRCHKGFIINVNYIRGIQPFGQKTSQIFFNGCEETALITKAKLRLLQEKYCL